MASGLAWKRLSPRWRELGLASSRMVKLACSLGKAGGAEGQPPQGYAQPTAHEAYPPQCSSM